LSSIALSPAFAGVPGFDLPVLTWPIEAPSSGK
jgi:hypothetical protein